MTIDNGRLKRTLEYDATDALMLAHAMMIAATTAWMCGHPGARDRCRKYAAMFQEAVPAAARVFDGDTWAEIGMALQSGQTFDAFVYVRPHHFDHLAVTIVGADGTEARFLSEPLRTKPEDRYRSGVHDKTVEAVAAVLAEIAPMGCSRNPANSGATQEQ